jgi:DNA-binding MarR family transcriptional regulator
MVDLTDSGDTVAGENAAVAAALAAMPREAALRSAVEQLYFAYRAFTAPPDRILGKLGLGRVHHRILYFVAHKPKVSVNALLAILNVSKQALNAPLRQLVDMELVAVRTAEHDGRVRQLTLTASGAKLEAQLTRTQVKLLQAAFAEAGADAEVGWHQVMHGLCRQDQE